MLMETQPECPSPESKGLVAARSRPKTSAQPVLHRLLIPLAAVLLLLVGGFGAALLHVQRKSLEQCSQQVLKSASEELEEGLADQSDALDALEDVLLREAGLIDAFKARDRDRLLADYEATLSQLRAEHGITHFYFHCPDRVNLLRVHKPEKNGDLIDRFTAREAERTGKTASGIELGPLGTFTLRVVQPVFDGDALIGYLELGKEIEDILAAIHDRHGFELAVAIRKNVLKRETWEAGMKMLGREADWDRFPEDVLIYSSLPHFPAEAGRFVDESGHVDYDLTAETSFNGKTWRVMVAPLTDVSGAEVGDLLILDDTSEAVARFNRLLTVAFGAALVLLSALLGFLYVLLRRTDRGIRLQQVELRESEEKFRGLVESSSDWIWEVDAEGVYVYASPQVEGMLGYKPEEIVGKCPFTLMGPDEAERISGVFKDAKEKGESIVALENVNLHKSGRHVVIETSGVPVLDEAGKVSGYRGVGRDITVRKRAEEEREVLLHDMKERVKEVTCMYGVANSIRQRNTLDEIFLDVAGMIPPSWHYPEITRGKVTFDDREYVVEPFEETEWKQTSDIIVGGRQRGSVEVYYLEECPELDEGPFMKEERRLIDGLAQALGEAVEYNRAEQQIQQYSAALESQKAALEEFYEAAEAATQAKSEFLANMSHEIRTPMTAILGFSDVLMGTEMNQEQLDAATTIKQNGEYLIELINDILDLSKIEAGKLEVEQIPCSPCQILSEVALLMRVRADAKNLPLEIEYDGPIPQSIQSDPTRLRQILINLTGNAVKFTEVGKVRLLARLLDAESDEPKMQFDVVDSGIGMTGEQIANLFQPFQQADTSTTRKFGGTGLGLSISKRLAEKLGGDIAVTSTLGEGSTFTVTVETGPLDGVKLLDNPTESEASTDSDKKPAAAKTKLDCRVLLAEDGHDNQRLISFLLKKAGAAVTVAENGQIAHDLTLAARDDGTPFDVILMDMQMPVMDGYNATARLREAGCTGPIIAITAHAMSTDRGKCLAAGCDDYLTKPIDRERLVSLVAKYAHREEPCEVGNAPNH